MITILSYISKLVIPAFIFFVILYGLLKKVKIYEVFVEGAKEGFGIGVKIIPYLVAILVAVRMFQSSGAFDFIQGLFSPLLGFFGIPVEVVGISVIKPLSGSASLGIFTDIIKSTGADSLATKISAVIMGSAETTFYVLAVYLGSVGIRKSKYLVPVCIMADIVGILIAIIVVKVIF